jgi:VCBS repeat-containing protein
VDGQLTYRYSLPAQGAPVLQPVSGHFEILNTTPFSIGGTRFKTSGGLKLDYQEDASRSSGILALDGDAKIDLEVIKGLPVQLGVPAVSLSDLLASSELAGKALPATNGWNLGQLKQLVAGQKEDLGLATIADLSLTSSEIKPKFYDPAGTQAFDAISGPTLKQLGSKLGLFAITPIAPAYTDTFNVLGLDGNPIASVVLDLIPNTGGGSPAQTSLKRQEVLTNKERLDLYAAYEQAQSSTSDVKLTTILDKSTSDAIAGFTKYFQAGTQKTSFGSVTINDTGVWTYSLDTSNSNLASVQGGYTIVPRINTQTGLTTNLKNVELQLNDVLVGLRPEAEAILSLLDSFGIRKLTKLLEKEISLPSYEPLRNTLLKLFESVPGNAYADGKLQVIEIIDTLYYTATRLNPKAQKAYVPLTPAIKGLGKVIGFAEGLVAQTWKSGGLKPDDYYYNNSLFRDEKDGTPYQFNNILLDLVYHNDTAKDSAYSWLNDAIVGLVGKLPDKVNLASQYQDPLQQIQAQNSYRQYLKTKGVGADEKQVSAEGGMSVNIDSTPLFAPTEFISRYLTDDQLDLLRLDLGLNIGVNAEVSYPLFPLVSALFGADLNVELLLNIISRLSRDDLNTLILSINHVKADAALSDTAKQSKVDDLLKNAFNASLSTDLSSDKFKIGIEPYVGLQLGFPLLNITAKMGLAFDYTVGFERLLNGKLADDQTVSLADFFGTNAATKSPYNYNPKFESLNFSLDHNYDFLLAKSPTDQSGFADFRTAYAQNSWLFNIYFEPINLKALIGDSKIAFDISLLKKLGNTLITSFDWVNIVDERIVTEGGIDFLFKDAKYLNSPVSTAFNNALKRQFPQAHR